MMFEQFRLLLQTWNAEHNERQKLQHTYLALIIVLTVIAGLASLVNGKLGHNLMFVVFAAIIAFACNAVVWNLLNSSLLTKLPKNDRSRNRR